MASARRHGSTTWPPWRCTSLDQGDRLGEIEDKFGIGLCNIRKGCTKVGPENIEITDNAIIPSKDRVVDRFYDPLRWLLDLFRGG